MKKIIFQFLVIALLIAGLGSECIGAQSSFAHTQGEQSKKSAAEYKRSKEIASRKSSISENQFFMEEEQSEEAFEELEQEERVKVRSSLRGFSGAVLFKGAVYNPFSLWSGRLCGCITGQLITESIINYIQNSDGKK